VITPVVSQFLRDANLFVASSQEALARSAPHIYISALPFAAKDSLVYRDFVTLCTGIISVQTDNVNYYGGLLMSLTGHSKEVSSIAYSPDGRLLASGSHDHTVRIWDTRSGDETMSPFQHDEDQVLCVAFDPTGLRIASGVIKGSVHVWDVSTGQKALDALRGHSGEVRSVAFSPDDMLIASASSDKFVFLWSTKTGSKISMLTGHTAEVNKVVFSSDGRFLASASDDMTVRLWSWQTGEALGELRISLSEEVPCITFSPDGKYLAVGSGKSFTFEACIWDMETMEPTSIRIRGQHRFMSLAYSSDGSKLVSAGWRTIRFWDPQSGQERPDTAFTGHSQWVNSVSFSPDGLYIASCSDDCTIRIWDAASNLESANQPRAVRHPRRLSDCISFSGQKYPTVGCADRGFSWKTTPRSRGWSTYGRVLSGRSMDCLGRR